VRLLLDTHAYLWWLQDAPRLSSAAREAVAEPGSLVFVSAATVWEMAIKQALGRIDPAGADLVAEIEANDFVELPIAGRHAQAAGVLPRHHDDPFDRMLIAQARLEGLTCVTLDASFAAYDVATIW
jgi:PIN domain nuclease of toxin-antitoxin system